LDAAAPYNKCTAVGSADQGFSGSGKHSEPPRHLKSAANTIRGTDLPLWNSRRVTLCSSFHGLTRCRCKWTGRKPCDTPQNLPEQLAWDRHFGHLEHHGLRVLCYLGTDLHELLPQCCERPVLHATGQRQTAQEIGQVVGQGEQLHANLGDFSQRNSSIPEPFHLRNELREWTDSRPALADDKRRFISASKVRQSLQPTVNTLSPVQRW
jgi:hypothetical protein